MALRTLLILARRVRPQLLERPPRVISLRVARAAFRVMGAAGFCIPPPRAEPLPPRRRVGGREVLAEPHLVTGGSEQRRRPFGNRLARAREASLTPAEGPGGTFDPGTLRGKRDARRSLCAAGPG